MSAEAARLLYSVGAKLKIDLYTKFILTIIAASLLALVGQNSVGSVSAADDRIAKVQICDPKSGRCAEVTDTLFGYSVLRVQ